MDRLLEDKRKELRLHVQGILRANAMAHKYVAEAANHLAESFQLLSTPGIIVLSQVTARPLIGVHLPLMNTFLEEAKKKQEETLEQRKQGYCPIDDICVDQNLPCLAREWEFQHEGQANSQLAAVTTRYIHQAMMRQKEILQWYSIRRDLWDSVVNVEQVDQWQALHRCRLSEVSLGIYSVFQMFFWPAEFPGYHQWQQKSQ